MFQRAVLLLLLVFPPQVTLAELIEQTCPGHPEVVVASAGEEDIGSFCRTAGEAIDFLGRYNVHPQRTIRFHIVETPLSSEGYDAFGRYDSRRDLIELMSYRAIIEKTRSPQMYDEPFDRVHYAGAVAHEVAHAIMQHNLQTELISPAPQEYLAHATQLGVLPEERRQRIIAAMGVGPWEAGDAISDIYMAMQPGRFAVKSYLHLTRLRSPEAFVRILLNANWFYVYVPSEAPDRSFDDE